MLTEKRERRIMKISGKKGLSEFIGEIMISMMMYMAVLFLLLFYFGDAAIQVHAIIEAENSEFACRNQMINLMNFKYDENNTFEQKFISAYVKQNYDAFGNRIIKDTNVFIEDGYWNLTVKNRTSIVSSFGSLNQYRLNSRKEELVECSTFVPVPCSGASDTCAVEFILSQKYEK